MKTIAGIKAYTVVEVAKQLDINQKTVMRMIADGEIGARKIGKAWYISETHLKTFIESADNTAAAAEDDDDDAEPEKVAKCDIEQEADYLYYVATDTGDVWRIRQEAHERAELVSRTGVENEDGYSYFVDADGDISRVRFSSDADETETDDDEESEMEAA